MSQPTLAPRVAERFRTVEAMDKASPWGGVYKVVTQDGRSLVLREMRIPPLRTGLDERLEQANALLREWRATPHPSRAALLEIFQAEGSLWTLMESAPGLDVEAFAARRMTSRSAAWRARVASSLARGLAALLDLPHCRVALATLTPRQVTIGPDGKVLFVNPGAGRFLRPGTPSTPARPELEGLAIRHFGTIMYTLLSGEAYQAGDPVLESALPDDLGDVVLRALYRHRPDAYPDLATLLADLGLFERMVEAEQHVPISWDDVELEPVKPPSLRKRLLPPPLYRLSETWLRFGESHPRIIHASEAALAVALIVLIAATWIRNMPPTLAPRSGPVVLVSESGGAVEVVDAALKKSAGTLSLGGEVTGMTFSPKLDRACFANPSRGELTSFDLGGQARVARRGVAPCPSRLILLPGQTLALGLGSSTTLPTYDLLSMTAQKSIVLPQVALDVVCIPQASALAYLTAAGDHVVLYGTSAHRVLAAVALPTPARALRADPLSGEIWVFPAGPSGIDGGRLAILDGANLQQKVNLELEHGALDVLFLGDTAYVLLDDGNLAAVARQDLRVNGVVAGVPGARRVVSPLAGELWFMSDASELEVHYLEDSGLTRHIPLQGRPIDVLPAI
jgi:hypothetical protein